MRRLFCIVMLVVLVGCSNNGQKNLQTDNTQMLSTQDSHIDIHSIQEMTNSEKADHLSTLAASAPQVNGATSLVLGDLAIVAIDVDRSLDESRVGTIKYTVAESLKKDPQGANAFIIADPDLMRRLIDVKNSIENGDPITGVLTELSNIVGRLVPEMPQMIQTDSPYEIMDQQNEQLNSNDKSQLEEIKNKQLDTE